MTKINTPPVQKLCANCQCCSPSGSYCYLYMSPTRMEYEGCNQWTKAEQQNNNIIHQ